MKRLLLVALVAIGTSAVSSAALIDLDTSSFTLSCGGNVNCSVGPADTLTFSNLAATLSIVYAPTVTTPVDANPTATPNFGTLTLACTGCTTNTFDLSGATLLLNVIQGPQPFADNTGSFGLGTFTGSVNVSGGIFGGNPKLNFPTTQFALVNGLETVTYTLSQAVGGYPLPQGVTTLQGEIEYSAVPEPSTYGLMGLGLLGLGMLRRRMNRK